MLEKLREIDTSVIKELVKINEEQDLIKDYLKKVEDKKGKVTDVVYQRVLNDYEGRHSALAEKAMPLKAEARKEYKNLRALHDQFNTAFEETRLAKEELEFRHDVGELDDAKMAELLKEAEQVLEQRRTDLEEADKLKQQFIEAYRSEDELEAEPEPPPAAARIPDKRPSPVEDIPADTPLPARSGAPEPARAGAGVSSDSPAPASSEQTVLIPSDVLPSSKPRTPTGDRTVVVAQAMLIAQGKGRTPIEHNLGLLTSVGRTPDNQIRIPETKVSRKHALITASPTGFTIKDLESQNGTFVNNEQITECTLNDGDRIRIGEKEFIFRLS